MKMNEYKKGKGGLHVKKKGKAGLSIGSGPSARSMAKVGKKIVLGSNNRGKTGRMDAM